MKRKVQPIYRNPIPCNPWIFWKECSECGWEFRRENGWVYIVGWGKWFVKKHICAGCGPDYETAAKLSVFPDKPAPPPRAP